MSPKLLNVHLLLLLAAFGSFLHLGVVRLRKAVGSSIFFETESNLTPRVFRVLERFGAWQFGEVAYRLIK